MPQGRPGFLASPSWYKQLLLLNYRLITPFLSTMPPKIAYHLNRFTGRIGKPLRHHTSFLYDRPAAPIGAESLIGSLNIRRKTAAGIVKNFFHFETRLEIEKLWLARNKVEYIPRILDIASLRGIADIIKSRGPALILSAHTMNYVMVLWALHTMGIKVSFLMIDPRSAQSANKELQQTVIDSTDALMERMPIIFTNEGDTVRRSIEIMKRGYSVVMLLDVPDYRNRGIHVDFLNDTFWVPKGCQNIFQSLQPPVVCLFSYTEGLESPYRISLSLPDTHSGSINVQNWADELQRIITVSPESWYGWFYLDRMR